MGTNTADSIRAGIFFGYVGALQHLIALLPRGPGPRERRWSPPAAWSRHFRGRVAGIDAFEPDLIFLGLRRIHEGLKEAGA